MNTSFEKGDGAVNALTIVLIVVLCLIVLVVLGGYGVYRVAVVRRQPKKLPKTGPFDSELRRYYTQHYLGQMQWLDAWGHERVAIQSEDGEKLAGGLFLAKQPTKRVVLAVHGYRSHAFREYLYMAPMYLEDLQMNLLLVDNYAHGDSGGQHIGFGYGDRADVLAWVNWLVQRFGPDCEILLQGVSMGASAVLLAAAAPQLPPQVKWVVADCGYTTACEMVRRVMNRRFLVPSFPFYNAATVYCKLLAGYYFGEVNVEAKCPKISRPVLFVHGEEDRFVPPEMGRRLHEACGSPKELLLVPGAAHAQSYLAAPDDYRAAVRRLLEKTPEGTPQHSSSRPGCDAGGCLETG